jgi:hypothetical protein
MICDETFWPHSLGNQLDYEMHYRGFSHARVFFKVKRNVQTPLACPIIESATWKTTIKDHLWMLVMQKATSLSSNITLQINDVSSMCTMLSAQIALFLAFSMSILALVSCRRIALYFSLMTYEIRKLTRLCRPSRSRYLRHRTNHELRNWRHRIRIIAFIVYLTTYYNMLEHSLGQSTLQPCSWVVRNVRWRRFRKSFPATIKLLGRNIDAGIPCLNKFFDTLTSDSKDVLSTFDPHICMDLQTSFYPPRYI